MAGSRRSPGLREEWRISQGPRDNSSRGWDSARGRDRASEQARGRNRHRGRHRQSSSGHHSGSSLSSRVGPPLEHRGLSKNRDSSFEGPVPSQELPLEHRRPSFSSSRSFVAPQDGHRNREVFVRTPGRGDLVAETFSQRGRNHSPRGPRRDRSRKNRNAGRHARGKPSQPPQRERAFQDSSFQSPLHENGESESIGFRGYTEEHTYDLDPTSQRSITPIPSHEHFNRGDKIHQSLGSWHSRSSRSTSPTREERMSPSRFSQSETYSRAADNRQYSSPHFAASANSYRQSSEPSSPHSGSRGSRNNRSGISPPGRSYSPSHTSSYHKSHGQIQDSRHQDQNLSTMPSTTHSHRGAHHHESFQDRRFSNHSSTSFNGSGSHRGRGHFNNLQWVASGPRDRSEQQDSTKFQSHSGSNTPRHQQLESFTERPYESPQGDVPRFSDEVHMTDQHSKTNSVNESTQNMPQPTREPAVTSTPPAKEGGKFSFAFKSKAAPPPAPKPVPDLAQRMQAREPPRGPASRTPESSSRNKLSGPPPPSNHKQDYRADRRDRDRDFHRGRGREDRRDFHPRNPRDQRREDRRFDPRDGRRRDDHRPTFNRNERRRDRSPDPKRQKRIIKRVKPRAVLPEEFRDSDSVYYRKPGDESVIGAGTYGKVFKAIHIYTQDKVALKRIRMEGEKDGFPVTAVREIKLLQHLRHDNVVSLLEVMVEKNECFMVFEYLSHDLTGLINHPTFALTASHKKDLAKQIFGGLQYLHHRGVLHRDIKAANILISNRGQLKYADFGLARFFSKSRQLDYTNRVITIWYRPPELLLGDTRYGPAVDIWSAACVFMEMFTKKAIFPGDGKELSQLNKLYASLGTPTRTDWPGIDEMPWVELMGPTERKKRVFEDTYRDLLSPCALNLMCQIFQYDPAKRPTADEVLAHSYFTTEEPGPQQATELENIEGDWHEFESKALRKERDREARRDREREKEKEKRRASTGPPQEIERDTKRQRQGDGDGAPKSIISSHE